MMKLVLALLAVASLSAAYSLKSTEKSHKRWDPTVFHEKPIYCFDSSTGQNEMCELREKGPRDLRNMKSVACFTVFNSEGKYKAGCWEQQHLSMNICTAETCSPTDPDAASFCCCFGSHCNTPL